MRHTVREFCLSLLLIAVVSVGSRHLLRVQAVEDLRQCRKNIHRISVACELYSCDNSGSYPYSLKQLVPGYLARLPECPVPSAGRSHYQYRQAVDPQVFSLCCSGENHALAGQPANCPHYSPVNCLVDR